MLFAEKSTEIPAKRFDPRSGDLQQLRGLEPVATQCNLFYPS